MPFSFKVEILIYSVLNFMISFLFEKLIVDRLTVNHMKRNESKNLKWVIYVLYNKVYINVLKNIFCIFNSKNDILIIQLKNK